MPVDGDISYADLAERVGLREPLLRRIIRHCIPMHRCFQEKREGFVSHSAASRLLHDSPDMYNTVGMMFAESWHAFARVSVSITALGVVKKLICDRLAMQSRGLIAKSQINQ